MNIWQNYLTRGFWGDEAWTALISSLPIPEIIKITGKDFHPPLYYLLVHGWIGLFGVSEWIRLMSLGFFILTPIAVYVLVKNLVDKRFGLLVGMVIAMSPILFTYAFEARAYALLTFLVVMAAGSFWKKRWKTYFFVGVMGIYTHYYMWFVLAALGLYWLVLDRKQIRKVIGVYAGLTLAQLPWLPTLVEQVKSVAQDYWIAPIDRWTHWGWWVNVTGGDFETPQRGLVVWTVLALLVLSLITVKVRQKKYPKGYIFLWWWLTIPVVLATVVSLYRPVFFYRYLIFGGVPILIISLWGLWAIRDWLAWGGGAFLMGVYSLINVFGWQRYPDTMREEINKILTERQTKIVTVLPAFAEVMFYTKGRAEVQVLPEGLVQFSGKALLDALVAKGQVTIAEPEKGEAYWLVEPGPRSKYVPQKK